jgi:hypothetical protein
MHTHSRMRAQIQALRMASCLTFMKIKSIIFTYTHTHTHTHTDGRILAYTSYTLDLHIGSCLTLMSIPSTMTSPANMEKKAETQSFDTHVVAKQS